jgi:anthranilate phosphoribosyltransferase
MMGKASSIEDGVERARSILDSGAAIKKLQEWIRVQNSDPSLGEGRFNDLVARADILA